MISVDGVDCQMYEPCKMPSKDWWSKKFNGPGVTYELGILIYENQLVWISGPHRPRGGRDLEHFRAPNGLKSKIPQGKKVIADAIYKDPVCSIWNPLDTLEVWRFKQRTRAHHETFNGCIKNFQVLSGKFRHGIDKHKEVFEAVCVIIQYEMENGHPLFDV